MKNLGRNRIDLIHKTSGIIGANPVEIQVILNKE